jgi:hypothetical protein
VRYVRRHCISGSDSGTSGESDAVYRMDLAPVYELRDLIDHSSSPDPYFLNFEASLSDVPRKLQIHGFSTVCTWPVRYHGGAGSGPIGCGLGRSKMTNWQAELDALMRETMRLTKSAGVQPVIPRAVIASHRMSPVTLNSSERDQIRRRVANFKAHQERFAREREDFAASLLKEMRGQS